MFRKLLIAGVVAGMAAAGLAYAFVGGGGLSADRQPGRIETAIARRLVLLSIPRAQRTAVNPLAGTEAWRDGAEHFGEHCAVCHGADGRGQSPIGSKMYPPVPDLASGAIQEFSDGALFSIIQNGVSWTGMPSFRSAHSADETWKLVSFVRRLPTLTPADLDRHPMPAGEGHATTIAIDGTRFQPDEATVSVGETVEWVNRDPFPHNVASDVGGFHSGAMEPDAAWRFRPTKRGTFRYVCTLHPTMAAVLHVK